MFFFIIYNKIKKYFKNDALNPVFILLINTCVCSSSGPVQKIYFIHFYNGFCQLSILLSFNINKKTYKLMGS